MALVPMRISPLVVQPSPSACPLSCATIDRSNVLFPEPFWPQGLTSFHRLRLLQLQATRSLLGSALAGSDLDPGEAPFECVRSASLHSLRLSREFLGPFSFALFGVTLGRLGILYESLALIVAQVEIGLEIDAESLESATAEFEDFIDLRKE